MATTEPTPLEKTVPHDCIVCWEPIPLSSTIRLSCGHGACRSCLRDWIERCEQEGRSESTCPHCRQSIANADAILGRPFDSETKHASSSSSHHEDSFTLHYLEENVHQCKNCGIPYEKEDEEDGDDIPTACFCGYIHCWTCNDAAIGCDCEYYEFWDLLTQEHLGMKSAHRFPVASPQQVEHSLREFMDRRRQAIDDYLSGEYDDEDEDSDEETPLQEEAAEANFVPLFQECLSDA